MLKWKHLSQTLTNLGWKSRIKHLAGNQIETFTLTFTHIRTETHIHANTHTHRHTHTFEDLL